MTGSGGGGGGGGGNNNSDLSSVLNQEPPSNTTLYIGNLSPDFNEEHLLRSIFEEFGPIMEVRMQKDKGYAFIKFQTHDQAARAIVSVHSRPIGSKCSWGKERTNATSNTSSSGGYQQVAMQPVHSYAYAQPMVQQQYGAYPSYPYYPYAYNQPVNYHPYMQGYPTYDPTGGGKTSQ